MTLPLPIAGHGSSPSAPLAGSKKAQATWPYDWLGVSEVRSDSVQGSHEMKNGCISVPAKHRQSSGTLIGNLFTARMLCSDETPWHSLQGLLSRDARNYGEKHYKEKVRCVANGLIALNHTKAHSIRLSQWVDTERTNLSFLMCYFQVRWFSNMIRHARLGCLNKLYKMR